MAEKDIDVVGGVVVRELPFDLFPSVAEHIEFFEILQVFDRIEDLNDEMFAEYVETFVKGYSDEIMKLIAVEIGYKEKMFAFLDHILSIYDIPNTARRFIVSGEGCKIPEIKGIIPCLNSINDVK